MTQSSSIPMMSNTANCLCCGTRSGGSGHRLGRGYMYWGELYLCRSACACVWLLPSDQSMRTTAPPSTCWQFNAVFPFDLLSEERARVYRATHAFIRNVSLWRWWSRPPKEIKLFFVNDTLLLPPDCFLCLVGSDTRAIFSLPPPNL